MTEDATLVSGRSRAPTGVRGAQVGAKFPDGMEVPEVEFALGFSA